MMSEWLAKSPLASALRTFVAVVITLAVADWTTGGTISLDRWQTWVIAAATSTLPVIVRWLNPADKAFGVGTGKPIELHDIFNDEV
jgi:hypothetical protein